MIVKEISASYARTVNLGNYESLRVELGGVVTLDKNDDAEKARAELYAETKKAVAEIVKNEKQKRGLK